MITGAGDPVTDLSLFILIVTFKSAQKETKKAH
jgi:hypothetical protein